MNANIICYDIVLDAATKETAYHFGMRVHEKLKLDNDDKWILDETEIQTNLIRMYGKCGLMGKCEEIWNDIKRRQNKKYFHEISIWNAMINAYGRNGDLLRATEYFRKLQSIQSLKPDRNTFILMINACGHSGEEEEANRIWLNEITDDVIKYDSFVVTSLVDCFSRKGKIERAYQIVLEYEKYRGLELHSNDENMWISLLSGARQQNDDNAVNQIYAEIKQRYEKNSNMMSRASILLSKCVA